MAQCVLHSTGLSNMDDIIRSVDFYHDEYEQFQRDVCLLIGGTLNASKTFLDKECETELAKIKAAMDKTYNPRSRGRNLCGDDTLVGGDNGNDERGLR